MLYLQKLKLFQFLMGLNDYYGQARSQILMMSPLPSVNKAYAMIFGDENKNTVVTCVVILGPSPSNFYMALYTTNFGGNHSYSH